MNNNTDRLDKVSEIISINLSMLEFIDYMGLRDDMNAFIEGKSSSIYPQWYIQWQAELNG